MAEVRVPAAAARGAGARPGAAIARAEGFEAHAASMEAIRENPPRNDAAPREITRKTGETDVSLTLGARRHRRRHARSTGVGFLDHMLDLLARHGRLDLDVKVDRRPRRPARTTRSRTPGSCSARRSTARSATARGIARYGHAVVPMDEARAACAIDVSGRPYCA